MSLKGNPGKPGADGVAGEAGVGGSRVSLPFFNSLAKTYITVNVVITVDIFLSCF